MSSDRVIEESIAQVRNDLAADRMTRLARATIAAFARTDTRTVEQWWSGGKVWEVKREEIERVATALGWGK